MLTLAVEIETAENLLGPRRSLLAALFINMILLIIIILLFQFSEPLTNDPESETSTQKETRAHLGDFKIFCCYRCALTFWKSSETCRMSCCSSSSLASRLVILLSASSFSLSSLSLETHLTVTVRSQASRVSDKIKSMTSRPQVLTQI